MITLASAKRCSGCTACKAICPKQAISMVADSEGFLRPQIDAEKCIQCHICERACPVLHPGNPDTNPTCYAAQTKDDTLRMASSSGGIFTELARLVLTEGGIVFGCVWEKPALIAIHAKAETEEELAAMRGSKYVQSDLRDTLKEAKIALQQGRKVLFSGTPCQIAGLNRFLGKPYDTLLTVEIICHGTPSPAVFEKYKQELVRQFSALPVEISFKDKRISWYQPSFVVQFSNNKQFIIPSYGGPWGQLLLNGLALRPSCHQCVAKDGCSQADITIGDFWGIQSILPKLSDAKGCSVVFLHTQKSLNFWHKLSTIVRSNVAKSDAIAKNPSYYSSSSKSLKRSLFFKNFAAKRFDVYVQRCIRGPWLIWMIKRCTNKIRRTIVSFLK